MDKPSTNGLARHDDNDEEEGVSLRPSDFEQIERPTLADVCAFKPKGERDDIATVDLPLYCRRALETIGHAARLPMSHVALWALQRGLGRLRTFAAVGTVSDARATLLATGSEHVVQLDEWRYRLQARDGSKRLTLRLVEKEDRNRLLGLAAGLGLSQQTTGAAAIVCGLADAPALPGDLAVQLAAEVRAFCEAVGRRALIAKDLAARAAANPAQHRQLSWAEVLGED